MTLPARAVRSDSYVVASDCIEFSFRRDRRSLFERERAVLDLAGPAVAMDHHAGRGCPALHQLQASRDRSRVEQPLARAEQDRERPLVVLVDQVLVDQCLEQAPAPRDMELAAQLLLQL